MLTPDPLPRTFAVQPTLKRPCSRHHHPGRCLLKERLTPSQIAGLALELALALVAAMLALAAAAMLAVV